MKKIYVHGTHMHDFFFFFFTNKERERVRDRQREMPARDISGKIKFQK